MKARLFHIHALSSLHCGTGQAAGAVDLPIARARSTKFPIVPGSSLRGVLRQQVELQSHQNAHSLFGPRTISGDGDSFAGALAVGDAHLLLMPVRCLAGIVSYVTSPFILRHYARDAALGGLRVRRHEFALSRGEALVTSQSVNRMDGRLVLEDLDLSVREDAALAGIAKEIAGAVHPTDDGDRSDVISRIAVVPDHVMSFLAKTATEIRARIAIDQKTGAVRHGALWYEESLPADAVMWGVYAVSESRNQGDWRAADDLAGSVPSSGTLLQLGGKAGVGSGLVRFLSESAQGKPK